MRLVRKEHIITTIFNKEILDDETIESVLAKLLLKKIQFSLTLRKYFSSDYDYRKIQYSKARVKKISSEDRAVTFYIFDGGTCTTIKDVSFDHVVEINATTTKSKILESYDDVSRFELMDFDEVSSEVSK